MRRAADKRQQPDPGKDHQGGAEAVKPGLLVDLQHRRGGLLAHTCLIERRLEIRVRVQGTPPAKLDIGLGLHEAGTAGFCWIPVWNEAVSPAIRSWARVQAVRSWPAKPTGFGLGAVRFDRSASLPSDARSPSVGDVSPSWVLGWW
jgi:hypothetical protein